MRKHAVAVVLCLVLGVAVQAQQQRSPEKQQQAQTEPGAVEKQRQEILQASERLRQAMLNSNADEMRQILATNYTGVDLMGRRLDRFDAVEVVAFGPLRFDTIDLDTQSIQVGDGGAVQSGSAYIRGTYMGQLFSSTYRFIRQWQRTGGEWKLVTTQIQGLGGAL